MRSADLEERLVRSLEKMGQHLEAIALCMCRRERVSIPAWRDEDYCNSYNHLPDEEEPEENKAVFADRLDNLP